MRTFLISISLIIFSFTKAYTQNYNVEAYKFHKSISEAQQNIGKEIYYFNNRATDLNLKILKFEINRSTKFIDSLKVYNNELTYYNAAKKLFLMYNDIANHEFVDLLKIIEDPDLEAKDFKAKKLKIFDTIKKKTASAYPAYEDAQLQFCKKYGLKQD